MEHKYQKIPSQEDKNSGKEPPEEDKSVAQESTEKEEISLIPPEYFKVDVSFENPETKRKETLVSSTVTEKEMRSPGSGHRRRRRQIKHKKQAEEIRGSEGDLFEISPELGKNKMQRSKQRKQFPSQVEKIPLTSPKVPKSIEVKDVEEEITCMAARSSLILPCSYRSPDKQSRSAKYWLQKLTGRELYSMSVGHPIAVWEAGHPLPKEIADLSPLFRQVFGWKEDKREEKIWYCHRLVLNHTLLKELFGHAYMCTIQNGEQNPYEVEINDIEILLYPLGTAILIIHLNWLPPKSMKEDLSLNDIRTLISVSKYRHKIAGVCNGWVFTPPEKEETLKLENIPETHTQGLGVIFGSRYQNEAISLSTLGSWLLHLLGEDPSSPPWRLSHARHAYHHSTVVVNKEPQVHTLQDSLFYLRHAYGQKNRPPNTLNATLGKILVWRLNRYIGVSKEGSVSFSWSIANAKSELKDDFEIHQWYKKFQGVFLLLACHVHGEKLVLYELSDMAASQAEALNFDEASNFSQIKNSRNTLRNLASLMVRYTLGMSSNECGGTSEYSDFFSSLREVFGVPELRDELSNELKDVLAVVESNYMEEERRQRDEQEAERRAALDFQKGVTKARAQENDAFQITIAILGSFSIPFVLVTGVFGMNLKNLPTNIDFWELLFITFGISILTLIGLLVLRWRLRLAAERKRERARDAMINSLEV